MDPPRRPERQAGREPQRGSGKRCGDRQESLQPVISSSKDFAEGLYSTAGAKLKWEVSFTKEQGMIYDIVTPELT